MVEIMRDVKERGPKG